MKTLTRSLLAVITLVAASTTAFAGEGWMTDFKAASAKAKAEKKPMLLDFTGSDWCGWCIKLDKEVFEKEAFKKYAAENLILVSLDFPRKKEISVETKTQNEALAKEYKVQGFPTIILLDANGKKIGQTGYQKGGPDAYVKHLKELLGS